jgi:hypothetical protein
MKLSRLSIAVVVTGAICLTNSPSADAATSMASGRSEDGLHVSVVVNGLNNPRHLSIGPDGALYVALAGIGDPTKQNCVPLIGVSGAPTTGCVGRTGAIGRVAGHRVVTVLGGLESEQEQDNGEVAGPAALTWVHGALGVIMQDTDLRADGSNGLPGGDEFGKGIIAGLHSPRSSWALFPDFAAFAAEHPQVNAGGLPGESATDSDPYGVTPYRGGWAVVDAAANSLLWVSPAGRLSILARFPTFPEYVPAGVLGPTALTIQAQAVPTSVTVGPDGALFVGGLRGVPSLPGTADVYRIMPGHAPTVWATGFSSITDLAFDRHSRLLVLEYSVGGLLSPPTTPGALIRVNRNGTRTTLLSAGLSQPTGLAIGRNGAIYIANYGTSSGSATPSGQILELTSS